MSTPGASGIPPANVLDGIVFQHCEEVAHLHTVRQAVITAPHVRLTEMARLDNRIAAHCDGLSVAGPEAWRFCLEALSGGTAGAAFTATVQSLEEQDNRKLSRVLETIDSSALAFEGVKDGLAWVPRDRLQGVVAALLATGEPKRRRLGLSACSAHGVDPGLNAGGYLDDPDPDVRAAATRLTAELGLTELQCRFDSSRVNEDEPRCRIWNAWATVVLGGRGGVLATLVESADQLKRAPQHPLVLAIQASSSTARAHEVVRQLAAGNRTRHWTIAAGGVVGDPTYVPWLLQQMSEPTAARAAGEAFSTITGIDLLEGFEHRRPENFESGPNDDPDDPNVDMDPDEGLPWPDVKKVEAWWHANQHRFQKGTRYFMGQPVTKEHCIHVLKTGYQRQRILAAQYLCLLEPGTPLFNTAAPAWRQQRLLAAM